MRWLQLNHNAPALLSLSYDVVSCYVQCCSRTMVGICACTSTTTTTSTTSTTTTSLPNGNQRRISTHHLNFQDSNECSLRFSALQQKKMHVSLPTLNHQESALGRPSVIMEATACVDYPSCQNVSYALYKDTSALNHAGRLPLL